MQLELLAFIENNPDWETILSEPPYCIKTKRDDGFVLLKYDQTRSDFTLSLVRECRGLILDEADHYLPVCVPFFKFGNFGESYIPEIDWATANVQEKLDGSLIKLWYDHGKWRVSSNGEIDARNAHINSALLTGAPKTDLYALFAEAWRKTGVDMESLDTDYTYMFELTSPHNRVVVRYWETTIRHIGTRNNRTMSECEKDIGIPKPRFFHLTTLNECIESANQLGYDEEGYVIVDSSYNRIKVKSPIYIALNHLSQGTTTHGHILDIIKTNEQEEFLIYFPEYRAVFDDVLQRIADFVAGQETALAEIQSNTYATRKDLAAVVTKFACPGCLFSVIDGKAAGVRDWLFASPTGKALEYIGLLPENRTG